MESLVTWFTMHLSEYISREAIVFVISLMPILELRGGLLAASLLQVPITTAIPLCVVGNILPIPFILLFIKKIFAWMRRFRPFARLVDWLENKAMSKSDKISRIEFWGLMLFVGIPIPGTGAWMGSLIAALLDIDWKKAILAELLGICLATVIMSFVSYGLLAAILS
ncbi:MAG: COG2426 family protein [Lachnospiraceae bacterium]